MGTTTDITARNESLRQILCDWRLSLSNDVESRVRRSREFQIRDGQDVIEQADAAAQEEMQFAVLERRATTLIRIDQALARLAIGDYGRCAECTGEITEARLRALPFAARCRSCEQQREYKQRAPKPFAEGSSLVHFSSAAGS
jgi:DnaK suppressor protein